MYFFETFLAMRGLRIAGLLDSFQHLKAQFRKSGLGESAMDVNIPGCGRMEVMFRAWIIFSANRRGQRPHPNTESARYPNCYPKPNVFALAGVALILSA